LPKTDSTEIGTKSSKIPKNDYSKKRFKFFRNTHESVKRDDLNMQTTIGKVLVSIKTNTGVPRKVAIGGEIQTPNIYTSPLFGTTPFKKKTMNQEAPAIKKDR
jgi:hypothetical protein